MMAIIVIMDLCNLVTLVRSGHNEDDWLYVFLVLFAEMA